MEIQPATLDQVTRTQDGRLIAIDDDVSNVARDLQEIDPRLRLRYSEAGEYFVVYLNEDGIPGNGHWVLSAQECDQRIVKRVREIASEDYDYAAELERTEAQKKREADHAFSEATGEARERLAHALRKDLGVNQSRIVVPGGK